MINFYNEEPKTEDFLTIRVYSDKKDINEFQFIPTCYNDDELLEKFDEAVAVYRKKLEELSDKFVYATIDEDTPWYEVKSELNDLGKWKIEFAWGKFDNFSDDLEDIEEYSEDTHKFIEFALKCDDFDKLFAYLEALEVDLTDFDSYEDYEYALDDQYVGNYGSWKELCDGEIGDMDSEFGYNLDFVLNHVDDEEEFFEDFWNEDHSEVVESDNYWFYKNR